MTDISLLMTKVKRLLHSVLLSSNRPLTAYEIERDYLRLVGSPLPYQILTYNSTESLLLDLRDLVKVTREVGRVTFSAAPLQNTQHIAELVSKNILKVKTDDTKSSGTGRLGGVMPVRDAHHPTPSSHLQQQIIQFLTPHPQGVPLQDFSVNFSTKFGFFPFGRSATLTDTEDRLRCIQQVQLKEGPTREIMVMLRKTNDKPLHNAGDIESTSSGCSSDSQGSSSESSNISHDLMSHQELSLLTHKVLMNHPSGLKASKFSREFQRVAGKPLPLRSLGFLTVVELMAEQLSDIVRIERPHPTGDWVLYNFSHSNVNQTSGTGSSEETEVTDKMSLLEQAVLSALHGSSSTSNEPDDPMSTLNDLSPIVCTASDNVSISERFALSDLSSSCSPVIPPNKHTESSSDSTPAGNRKTALNHFPICRTIAPCDSTINSIAPSDPTVNRTAPIDPTVKSTAPFDPTVNSTASSDPTVKSIAPSDPTVNSTASSDPTVNSTAPSDPSFSRTTPNDPTVSRIGPTSDPRVRMTALSDPNVNKTTSNNFSICSTSITTDPAKKRDKCSRMLETIRLPVWLDSAKRDYYPVIVSQISNPSHFYITSVRENNNKTSVVNKIAQDIMKYCTSSKGEGLVEREGSVVSLCAVYNERAGLWCRAAVIGCEDEELVQVEHVDYGTTALVPLSKLYSLPERLRSVSRQCVRARLAHVAPSVHHNHSSSTHSSLCSNNRQTWCDSAVRRFQELVSDNRVLLAKVLSLGKEGVASVLLCDTSTEVDIHINDKLIEEGLAQVSPSRH